MFVPLNRHILVKREENEEPVIDRSFVLPDDYEKSKDPYEVVVAGDKIVVERSMVNAIKCENKEYDLVLENYVYGVMQD